MDRSPIGHLASFFRTLRRLALSAHPTTRKRGDEEVFHRRLVLSCPMTRRSLWSCSSRFAPRQWLVHRRSEERFISHTPNITEESSSLWKDPGLRYEQNEDRGGSGEKQEKRFPLALSFWPSVRGSSRRHSKGGTYGIVAKVNARLPSVVLSRLLGPWMASRMVSMYRRRTRPPNGSFLCTSCAQATFVPWPQAVVVRCRARQNTPGGTDERRCSRLLPCAGGCILRSHRETVDSSRG